MSKKRELQLPDGVIPERLVPWEELDNGRVDLLVPRWREGWLARWMNRWLKHPTIRVHLDDLGSFVWLRCDGERSVGQISAALTEELGDDAEMAPERLGMFLQHMQRVKLARLMVPQDGDGGGEGQDEAAADEPAESGATRAADREVEAEPEAGSGQEAASD